MGFLQGDTNNIILDAVLTDTGRKFLSRQDGSFTPIRFALGDDEVDYTIIQKFGRTVGKEKIEKNTPVFEALTNGSLAQKYRCISIPNPNLVTLPSLDLTGAGSTTNTIVLSTAGNSAATIVVAQSINGGGQVDSSLIDNAFIIEMNNLFLQISGDAPENVDSQRKATYIRTKDSTVNISQTTFNILAQAITDTQFQIYGAIDNKSRIDTYVKVSGVQSGAVKEFKVQIYKNSAPTT